MLLVLKMTSNIPNSIPETTLYEPSEELPRDETGSYLHLKLKRFRSIDDLTMPYAKKTWADHPHDAEIDYAPSSRSKCRHCHSMIQKGELRVRLWMQCHKGCKNSAYFHGKDCIWKYPEIAKIKETKEFVGLESLREMEQNHVADTLEKLTTRNISSIKRKPDQVGSLEKPKTPTKIPRKEGNGRSICRNR